VGGEGGCRGLLAALQLARPGSRVQLTLGEILGSESSDELLGRIFSSFCMGK